MHRKRVFFDAVRNKPQNQTKAEAMRIASETFNGYTNLDNLKRDFKDYIPLANQVARTKTDVDVNYVYDKLTSLTGLSSELIIRLWDNMYYQVVTEKDFYIKENLLDLLIVQNIAEGIKRINDKPLALEAIPIMANARAVLLTELFDDKGSETEETEVSENPVFSTKALERILDISMAESLIKRSETAIMELNIYLKKYQKEYMRVYNRYNSGYQYDV